MSEAMTAVVAALARPSNKRMRLAAVALQLGSVGIVQQSGAVEACWAHNPEVRGSKPRSATFFGPFVTKFVTSCDSQTSSMHRKTFVDSGILSVHPSILLQNNKIHPIRELQTNRHK